MNFAVSAKDLTQSDNMNAYLPAKRVQMLAELSQSVPICSDKDLCLVLQVLDNSDELAMPSKTRQKTHIQIIVHT